MIIEKNRINVRNNDNNIIYITNKVIILFDNNNYSL